MVNPNQKTFKEAEEVLSSAVQRGITISEACILLDKSPSIMTGMLSKIETAFKSGVINEKKRNTLIELYTKCTKIALSRNQKLKKTNKSADKKPALDRRRLVKGAKPSEEKSSKKKAKNDKLNNDLLKDDYLTEDDSMPNLTRQEKEMLEYDAESDDKYDERSTGEILRGDDIFVDGDGNKMHRITGYQYKIYIKGEKPLEGEFTREEMDKIYRLYSSMDGAGLTLRAVSREFHLLNYRDFKRILRAFNITKASLAVAPHILEEYSEDDLVALIRRNKENSLLKKLDVDRQKYYEKKFFETKKEIVGIKSNSEWIESIVDNYFTKRKPVLPAPVSKSQKDKKYTDLLGDKPVFCIFGDIHYGKKFDNPVFGRGYNKNIAHERMMEIAFHTIEEAKRMKVKEIVMICLGDLIECALEDGMHPGHSQEMDLHQEEQIFFAIDSMIEMLNNIISKTDCKITFCSIHGNHDRLGLGRDDDKSRTAGKVITGMIKRLMENEKRLEVIMPKNNLLKLIRGKICVFAQHGDSSMNKKKPSELVNLWGEGTSSYHLLLKGHWHSLKADEGTNYLTLTAPSVASTDKYIMEELGNNNLPGFILGHEPNCYGFNYKKITLY